MTWRFGHFRNNYKYYFNLLQNDGWTAQNHLKKVKRINQLNIKLNEGKNNRIPRQADRT